jgi:hypothetical protein
MLVARATDAAFLFPNSIARGLLWRCVTFAAFGYVGRSSEAVNVIKETVARHLSATGEWQRVIVDDFLLGLQSEKVFADVNLLKPTDKE